MSRLLVRAAKAPWVSTPAETVLTQNIINTNVGNLLFGQSVMRTLSVPNTEVVANGYLTARDGVDDAYIGRVNEEFDAFVVPLANAFRRGFRRNLKNLTHVIERLDIPVTVVGVGSQHPLDDSEGKSDPMARDVQRFMAAVLDRSASVGVRGELTARYLKSLGFGDDHVDVIGCPSIYLNGPNPTVRERRESLGRGSRISVSASPQIDVMVPVIRRHAEVYPNLVYIPQNSWDLATLMWADPIRANAPTSQLVAPDSPLHQRDQIRFPLDPRTWIEYLRGFDFAFGTRIHGTVAAILAGTPATLLAHDSRTLELADYHGIPYRRIDRISSEITAPELHADADYTAFHANSAANFGRFTGFMEKNGLAHIYQPGNASTEFDEKLSSARLPPLVHPVLADGPAGRGEVVSRLRWLRRSPGPGSDPYVFEPELPHTPHPEPTLSDLGRSHREAQIRLQAVTDEVAGLRRKLERTEADLTRQQKIIKRLDVPISTHVRRAVTRIQRRAKRRLPF